MKKKILLILMFLVGLVFISSNAFAAWTQAKGHSYNQVTYSYYKTVEKFSSLVYNRGGLGATITGLDGPTNRIPSEEFKSKKWSYYGEFGLADNFTFIASGGWDNQQTNDAQKNSDSDGPSGIGDIILGVRQKISDNLGAGVLSSVEFALKIPEAYDYGDPILTQSLGDGQYDATAKLVFGKGFNWGYTVFSTGYKYRFENKENGNMIFKPSDQMLFSLSGGYNAFSWLSIRGGLDYNKPVGNAEVSQELLAYNRSISGRDWHGDVVMVKDTLGLEAESLAGSIALAFTVRSGTQVVVSYTEDLYGKDASLGRTYSLALAMSL